MRPGWAAAAMSVLATLAVVVFVSARSTTTEPPASAPPAPTGRYGWQLTAGNTGLAGAGVDRTTLPVFAGPVPPGATLSLVKITEGLDLTDRPDVTLDRVWLQPLGTSKALILGPGTVIRNSDIDGSLMPPGERWGLFHDYTDGAPYTIDKVQVTGVSVGAQLDGLTPGTMADTYIHGLVSTGGAHLDGFTRRSGSGPLSIVGSRLTVDFGSFATGAFFLQNAGDERIAGVTLQDTYLEGDGWVMTLENRGPGTDLDARNVRIRFTEYGAVTTAGRVTVDEWTDVFLYDPSKPDAAGAAVPRP